MMLYSNLSREMWKIDEDLTGGELLRRRLLLRALNMMRYGDKGKGAPNCQHNLETAIRGYGMDRWNFNVDACFNVFMTVAYDADGKWEIRLPKGKPGDYMIDDGADAADRGDLELPDPVQRLQQLQAQAADAGDFENSGLTLPRPSGQRSTRPIHAAVRPALPTP